MGLSRLRKHSSARSGFLWHSNPNAATQVFDSNGTMTHHGSFADTLEYDKRYSAQLGAQVNRPEYASSDFGEWGAADVAVFYPSPLDNRGKASADTPGSTHYIDHLLAYVRGATETPDNRYE